MVPYEIRSLPRHMRNSPLAKYYFNPHIAPQEYWDDIGDNSPKDASLLLKIEDRNDIFNPGYLPCERGWAIFPDGTGTCAGYMKFPNATPEMMYWWFAWMPVDPMRGKIWEPKNHEEVLITRDQIEKLVDYSVPLSQRTWGVHFYPVDLGVRADPNAEKAPVRIQFYSPADFGLDEERMKAAGDIAVICAQVGPIGGKPITSFMHTCRKTDDGMELRSHFWYGWRFEDGKPVHADFILPTIPMMNMCKSQNIHLIEEYYQLSCILPELYETYSKVEDKADDYV